MYHLSELFLGILDKLGGFRLYNLKDKTNDDKKKAKENPTKLSTGKEEIVAPEQTERSLLTLTGDKRN